MHADLYEPLNAQSAIWRQLSAVKMNTGEVAQLPEGAGRLVKHGASSLLVRDVYVKFWTLVTTSPGDSLLLVPLG